MKNSNCFQENGTLITFQSLAIVREQRTSTWLSVTAKGINLEKFIDFQAPVDLNEDFQPICPELLSPSPILTLDHLPAYHLRHQFIHYKPEKGLTDVGFSHHLHVLFTAFFSLLLIIFEESFDFP